MAFIGIPDNGGAKGPWHGPGNGEGQLRAIQVGAAGAAAKYCHFSQYIGLPEKGKTIAPQLVSAAQSW
jgi:hypothetical protein